MSAGLSVRPWDGHVWRMQPEAQTFTRGSISLAVSAGALEIAIVIQGSLAVLSLYFFTQLLETINGWSIALCNQHAVDAVYTLILLRRSTPSVIRNCCTSQLLIASLVIYSIVWLISCIIAHGEFRYLTAYLALNMFQVASSKGAF